MSSGQNVKDVEFEMQYKIDTCPSINTHNLSGELVSTCFSTDSEA